jgi:predicted amidohydrolase
VSAPGLSATTTTPEAKRTSGETDGNSGVKSTAKTPSPLIRLFGLTRPGSWSISSRCSMAGMFNTILCEPRNTTTFRFSAGGCRYSDAVRAGNPSIGWLSIATMTSCPSKAAASAGPLGSTSENGTLYNSLLTITAEAKLANHHRKLVPTHTERLIWGNGDGRGLSSVNTKTSRIGGLICWEHWMPLARMAMHNSGEHIHVAVWPTAHELHQLCSRHYAFEGRCFVLAVGLMMPTHDLPSELQAGTNMQKRSGEWLERGGSAIIAPDSRYIVEPVYDREQLIVADLNLGEIDQEFLTLDVSGHRRDWALVRV